MPIMPRFSGCDAGNAAEAEQRHRDRDVGALGELRARSRSAPEIDDAVAGEDHRPLGRVDQLERVLDLARRPGDAPGR